MFYDPVLATVDAMTKLKKSRLSESAIEAIKTMIRKDGFNPGDKFYSETQLTKMLGVSRSSIREAMRILEVMGHVTVRQGKGIYIADPQGKRFKEFSSWLKSNELTIKDNFEVRLIIEPKAAGNAAERADEEDIRQLESVYQDFIASAEAGNVDEAIVCDGRFHCLLAAATKNRTLQVMMEAMITSLPNAWISSLNIPGRLEKTVQEHGNVLKAIKKRDKNAAENAMTRHLANAVYDITSQIDEDHN